MREAIGGSCLPQHRTSSTRVAVVKVGEGTVALSSTRFPPPQLLPEEVEPPPPLAGQEHISGIRTKETASQCCWTLSECLERTNK